MDKKKWKEIINGTYENFRNSFYFPFNLSIIVPYFWGFKGAKPHYVLLNFIKKLAFSSIFIAFFISAVIHLIIFLLIFGQATQRELIVELSPQKKAVFFKERYKKNKSLKVSMSKLNGEINKFLNIKIKDTKLRVAMLKLKKNSVTYGNTVK